jgi:hypothetical protein
MMVMRSRRSPIAGRPTNTSSIWRLRKLAMLSVTDTEAISKAILLGEEFVTRGNLYGYPTQGNGYVVMSGSVKIAEYIPTRTVSVWNHYAERLDLKQVPGEWLVRESRPTSKVIERDTETIRLALAPTLLEKTS